MEHGTDSVQRNPNTRTAAFAYLGSQVLQSRFDVRPCNIGFLFEDRREYAFVLTHDFNDITL